MKLINNGQGTGCLALLLLGSLFVLLIVAYAAGWSLGK